jgi:hypothetical protein
MKIIATRSGGFAGVTESLGTVDTSKLDAAQARDIAQLVEDLNFFRMPEEVRGTEIGADLFQYEVTVLENGRSHTVRFTDQEEPTINSLRRLMDAVTHAAW